MGLVHHLPEVMECFAKAGGLPPDTRVHYMYLRVVAITT